jgi:hypothetical protein
MNAVAGLNDTFARIGLTILRGAGLRMALSPRLSGWLSARAKGQAGRRLSRRTQHEKCGKPPGCTPIKWK